MFFLKLSWDFSRLLVLMVRWDVLCSWRVYHCPLSGSKKVMLWFLLFPLNGFGLAKKHNEAFTVD